MNCFLCKVELKEKFKLSCKLADETLYVDICSSCHEKIFQEITRTIKYGYSMGCHVGDKE